MSQDFYFENNCIILTETFLKKRGFCCENGCRHCPYKNMKYVLKTNNDLQFDFKNDDNVIYVDSEYTTVLVKIQDIEYFTFPFNIEIGNEEYTIVEMIKIEG